MDMRERINLLAETDEDRFVLTRLVERMTAAANRNIPAAVPFLSLRQQAYGQALLSDPAVHFFGGYGEAERAVCCYVPDYLDPVPYLYGEDSPIQAVEARFYEGDSLSHRDFLGALMGMGIKRETVGDILVHPGRCQFLVTREIAPYVLQNLQSAGRTRLQLSPMPFSELAPPVPETKTVQVTVASLRLDSVTAAGFGLSRAEAVKNIETCRTAVNGIPCEKPDFAVREGDRLTVRGMGKIELKTVGGTTRKGRIGITILRYI